MQFAICALKGEAFSKTIFLLTASEPKRIFEINVFPRSLLSLSTYSLALWGTEWKGGAAKKIIG